MDDSISLNIPGILWFNSCDLIDLKAVPLLSYTCEQASTHLKQARTIVHAIAHHFASKNHTVFNSEVMDNWNCWLDNQQQLWSPTDTSPENAPDICAVRTCEMVLPKSFNLKLCSMDTSSPISMQIEDSASADVPDDMQLVTHASGSHGSFTKYERLTEIWLLLADADFTPKPADIVFSKMECIILYGKNIF